jgi:hypothetical protein
MAKQPKMASPDAALATNKRLANALPLSIAVTKWQTLLILGIALEDDSSSICCTAIGKQGVAHCCHDVVMSNSATPLSYGVALFVHYCMNNADATAVAAAWQQPRSG